MFTHLFDFVNQQFYKYFDLTKNVIESYSNVRQQSGVDVLAEEMKYELQNMDLDETLSQLKEKDSNRFDRLVALKTKAQTYLLDGQIISADLRYVSAVRYILQREIADEAYRENTKVSQKNSNGTNMTIEEYVETMRKALGPQTNANDLSAYALKLLASDSIKDSNLSKQLKQFLLTSYLPVRKVVEEYVHPDGTSGENQNKISTVNDQEKGLGYTEYMQDQVTGKEPPKDEFNEKEKEAYMKYAELIGAGGKLLADKLEVLEKQMAAALLKAARKRVSLGQDNEEEYLSTINSLNEYKKAYRDYLVRYLLGDTREIWSNPNGLALTSPLENLSEGDFGILHDLTNYLTKDKIVQVYVPDPNNPGKFITQDVNMKGEEASLVMGQGLTWMTGEFDKWFDQMMQAYRGAISHYEVMGDLPGMEEPGADPKGVIEDYLKRIYETHLEGGKNSLDEKGEVQGIKKVKDAFDQAEKDAWSSYVGKVETELTAYKGNVEHLIEITNGLDKKIQSFREMAQYQELAGVLGRGILQEAWRVMSELGIQMHTVWIRYNQITPGNAWMTPLMKQQRINDTYYELFQNMMELYNRLFYGIFAKNYVIADDPSSSWWNPNMTGDAGFNADVAYRHFLRIFDLYGYGVDTDAGIKLIEQDVGMKILDQMLGQHFEFGLTEAEQQLMRMRAEITGDYAKYFDTEDEFSRRVTQVLMGGSGGLGDALGTLDDIAARPGTYSDLQKDLDNLEQERRTRLYAVKQKLARSEISQASYNQEVNSINEDINRRKQQLEKGEGSTGSANNLIEGLYQLFQQGIISDIEFYKYATEGYYVGNPQNIITEIYQNSVIGEARFNRVIDHVEADGTPVFKTLNGSYAKKMEELKRKFLLHGDSFNAQTGNWVAGTASNTAGGEKGSGKNLRGKTPQIAAQKRYILK